jgi:hypothetical protein
MSVEQLESGATASPSGGPKGIGGWLVLPMIGLFALPLLTVSSFLNGIQEGGGDLSGLGTLVTAARTDPARVLTVFDKSCLSGLPNCQ